MSINLELTGLEEALKRAARFNHQIRDDVAMAVKKSGQNIKKTARANVRRRTGRLRGSITMKDTSKRANVDKGLAKTVHARNAKGGSHSHLVERGTKSRSHPIFGTSGRMPASPFIRPAEDAEESRFQAELRRIVRQNEVI